MYVKLSLRFMFSWNTNNYKLLTEIYPSVITRKSPIVKTDSSVICHTHVLLYEMTSLTATDVYLILTNAVLLSVSVLLCINPQRSHTEEVVGDYCGQWMFGDNLKQGAHKERCESQQ